MRFSESVGRIVGSRWLRAAGIACLLLIVILSLIPGRWQERTSLPGPIEHFVAYSLTATILGLATRRRYPPVFIILGLAVLAATMELLQHFSPGRDPEFIGFFGSSMGALAGALWAHWMRPRENG